MKRTLPILAAALTASFCFAQADAADAAAAALADGKALEGPKEWNTTLSVGGSLTRGNSDTLVANGRLATEKLVGDDLFNASLEGAYGEAEETREDGSKHDETNVDNSKLSLGYKHRFDGFFAFADAFLLTDDIAEIDYRGMPSVGLGTFLVDNETFRLTAKAGVGYLWEKVDGVKDDYATYVFGERGVYTVSETSSIWEEATYIGSWEDSDDYLVTAEVGADAAMSTNLKLGVVLKYTYDNTPASGCERDDLALVVQVGVQL